MEKLYSINKASDLLERDRATLVRALRHVPPDGFQGDQPRWKMPTIVAALAKKPQERREAGKCRDRYGIRGSSALDDLRAAFEKRVKQISAEPLRDRRRELAVALAPLIGEYQTAYLDAGRSLGIAEDMLGARADLIVSELLDEVAEAAEWPRHGDDFVLTMIEAMQPQGDAEAA